MEFPQTVDTTGCEHEPIRIPGSIQPHGFLLVLSEPDFRVTLASANAAAILEVPSPYDRSIDDFLPPVNGVSWRALLSQASIGNSPQQLGIVGPTGGGEYLALAHRHAGKLILEFERTAATSDFRLEQLHAESTEFLAALQASDDASVAQDAAVRKIRKLTGFDRVLLYQFDEDQHGTTIAESGNDLLPGYLGLRFPADDIPAQARELYRLNRVRLILDANYIPVPIVPSPNANDEGPLDLTYAVLRSVSPVHLEYMRNMGTAASMSISVVNRGRLWGLIACHHTEPRFVPFAVRAACDFVAQILSLQIETHERAAEAERRVKLRSLESQLLTSMAGHGTDYSAGLVENKQALLEFADASGAAVVVDQKTLTVGRTPDEHQLIRIAEHLAKHGNSDVVTTDCLTTELPFTRDIPQCPAGMAAISISKLHPSFVLWFRDEKTTTVHWAGDPRKPPRVPGQERLHPRKSFEVWKETVRGHSARFTSAEREALADLRNSIIGIVLRTAEENADLSAELQRSNKELEAFSYSVSHDLRAPFRHIVGYSELLRERAAERLTDDDRRHLQIIADSAETAGQLVDNLLAYSRMGRTKLAKRPVNLNEVFRIAQTDAMLDARGRRITWNIGDLPTVEADPSMLQSVAHNLLSNAVKFTRTRSDAVITVRAQETPHEYMVSVRDNGVGFDMAYADKLFGVFQRMHRMEDFEGTGIGLANVQRIMARHGGRAWAQGAVDCGAEFTFSLPKSKP
ncbi:MAG: ATPase [Pirellula sp.]|nr:ATPase [Pirellula sp.]